MNQAEVIKFCDQLLKIQEFKDYCPNGMEVEGDGREVRLVALGVSLTSELIEQALDLGAELMITHHGILWDGNDPRVVGPFARKLRSLLVSGVAAASYHLPLDYHPQLGNNAQLAEALGMQDLEWVLGDSGRPMLLMGRPAYNQKQSLTERLTETLGRAPVWLDFGPKQIERLAICSGGAQKYFEAAVAAGAQAYLTGEGSEFNFGQAQDAGAHYIAAGHYATETLGIKALGAYLEQELGLKTQFLQTANPL
ncbi:MAG: Nif3-like dinuclear metal center hexameric protein [bacterium]|nr:Nif3-like dinuclear metal center hexameric protein [bacterium]